MSAPGPSSLSIEEAITRVSQRHADLLFRKDWSVAGTPDNLEDRVDELARVLDILRDVRP